MNLKQATSVLICALAVTLCACGASKALPSETPPTHVIALTPVPTQAPAQTTDPTPAPTPAPTPSPISVTLAVVGDLMVHEMQYVSAKTETGYDFSEYFEYVKAELSGADYTVGNLECPVTGDVPTGYPSFNAPAEFLDELVSTGFDAVTLANNHILDKRAGGIDATIDNLDERGLASFGAWKEGKRHVLVADVNGVNIALLGYAEHTNGHDDTQNQVDHLTQKNIEKDVAAAKELGADLIIAFPHWGDEDTSDTTHQQHKYAEIFANAGVDAVLGSHPHVLQPFVHVRADDGTEVPVMYSMGNFISNQQRDPNHTGVIIKLEITKDAAGETSITSIGYMPTFVYKTDGKAKYMYRIIPIDSPEADKLVTQERSVTKLKRSRKYVDTVLGDCIANRLTF